MSRVRFVVRWKKGNKLIDASGQERKAWEIARGKRAWGEAKLLWDTHFRVYRSTRVLALPVRHPEYRGPLWLVVVRQGKGREPWYLLTNEPVETAEHAWEITFSSVRRWKIEIVVSMSGKGNWYDNAATEALFGSLKDECVHRTFSQSHEEARQSLFEYLEVFSHRQRRHSSLGYLSPLAFEHQWEVPAENPAVFLPD